MSVYFDFKRNLVIGAVGFLFFLLGTASVFAAGITIPAGSSLNVNTGTMRIAGDVTNGGTLLVTTGAVSLTGNWVNSGTFTAGSGEVSFTAGASVTQTLNSGGAGTGKLFYHLTHSGAGTLQLVTNAIDIDGNFTNASGIFNANALAISCAGNWINAATYTHNNNSVTLDGLTQSFTGSSIFYNLTKTVTSAAVLTFDNTAAQTVVNSLTLQGVSGQLLSLRSNAAAAYNLTLQPGGIQNLAYLDVQYSDASGGIKLVGGTTSVDSGNNTNWAFAGTALIWDGSSSSDWDTAQNWDLGIVPRTIDTAAIPDVTTDPVISSVNVTIVGLTVQSGGLLTLNSKNLTLSGALDCDGTITITNAEILKIGGNADFTNGIFNKASGTAQFTASANLTSALNKFNHFTIDDAAVITCQDKIEIDGTLTTSGTGTLDLNSQDLQIATSFNLSTQNISNITNNTVTFDASSGTQTITSNSNSFNHAAFNDSAGTATFQLADAMDVNGSFTLTDGIFDQNSQTLNVGGNWSFNGGSFVSNPSVTFDSAVTSVISGSTTFNNFTCTTAGKQLNFTAGTVQTVAGTLTLTGTTASKIKLRSSSGGSVWTITDSGTEAVSFVDVQDSIAANSITAYNSTNSGNNTNWVFNNLSITYPANAKTVGQTPTLIGLAGISESVTIADINGNTVAAATADTSGNWRVAVSTSLTAGANSLTPYAGQVAGTVNNLTVVVSPTTDQVPTIILPAESAVIRGNKPAVTGKGLAGQTVTLTANDANGNLLLTDVAASAVGSDGNYTISSSDYATNLVKGTNYFTVTVDGVVSAIITVSLVDPFGVVFDSISNNPIKGAVVTIYTSTGVQCVSGVQIAAADLNPQTTGADGLYSYLTINGDFYITVSAAGYNYPSSKTSFPAGRTIVTGSKGEIFTVAGVVIEMDHPADSNNLLLKVKKDANKKEVVVGDVVTYTVTIQNETSSDVTNVYLEDKIPAGFKYISGKAILDNTAITDPQGNRPITFNIGTVSTVSTRTLKYQLVVGAGVILGNYENNAYARYSDGTVISNRAIETVKVVPDPLFDLGTIIGKVFWDFNENGIQDNPLDAKTSNIQHLTSNKDEFGIANVQIATEEGTVITTDKDGKYHLPAIIPGRHILRLDERTLPEGSYLTTDKAVIIDITEGILTKVNFGVKIEDRGQKSDVGSQRSETPIKIIQEKEKPQPRLNAALCPLDVRRPMLDADTSNQYEFRIFTNYSIFIEEWKLEILDRDTKALVKKFEGTSLTINEPVIWNGELDVRRPMLDADTSNIQHLTSNRSYVYALTVTGRDGRKDVTKERELIIREQRSEDRSQRSEREIGKEKQQWLEQESKVNNLEKQNIRIEGETVLVHKSLDVRCPMSDAKTSNIQHLTSNNIGSIRVIKGGKVEGEIPLFQPQGITASDVLKSSQKLEETSTEAITDIILPKGEYDIEVIYQKSEDRGQRTEVRENLTSDIRHLTSEVHTQHLKIGEDYLFFVAMGDTKAGYTVHQGSIEPVQPDDKFREGFWLEGKLAYYLKGKIKGRYLVTSSLDTERVKKELFKNLDADKYYPVYGDTSSVNYGAANTQGPLYLLVEWDKSSAVWGNYNTAFTDTEFAAFSRSLYGGKVYYEDVSITQFGEPRTKLVVFRATAKQKAAHNEFISTGGSLYYLNNKDVTEGSDKVKIEVRDAVTNLVLGTKQMESGVEYQIDYSQGRIIFWKPVSQIAESDSIISVSLLAGNPVYVVADYEYQPKDKYDEGNIGGRVQQSLTDYLRVGGTYIEEEQPDKNYLLKGTDAVLHLGKDIKFTAEYAQSESEQVGSFISTDGGLSWTELATGNLAKGKAYGLKAEANLLSRLGITGYYKQIGKGFSSAATVQEQGKELIGASAAWDITAKTRLKVSHDIQKLIDDGNLSTQAQVGAGKTETTSAQLQQEVVTDKLKLTGEYRKQQVREKKEQFESETNVEEDTAAIRADYKLTSKIDVSLEQQTTLKGSPNHQTTAGVQARVNDKVSLRAKETIGIQGTATGIGATANVKDKFEVSSDWTRDSYKTGQISDTTSISGKAKVDDKTQVHTTVAVTDSSEGGQTQSLTFGSERQVNEELKLAGSKSYARSRDNRIQANTYGLTKEKQGKKLEGTWTEQKSESSAQVSNTNIFGLSGDINDKWAAQGSFERGIVQGYDGSQARRNAGAVGIGFVDKDKQTGEVRLKASSKSELRLDDGQQDKRQFLLYNAIEGKVNPNTTLFAKLNYSQTKNMDTMTTEAQYKEYVTGLAYRPVSFDRLNLLGKYTYLEDDSPSGQSSFSDIEKEKSHILAGEAVYDLTDKWQIVEKLAYKTTEERVTGFDFTKTQTWLTLHRLNYNVDKDWQVGAEYRRLIQKQADDSRQGVLVEVARKIGEFIQAGAGYNFTDFNDDLTHLDYTAQGPFIRLTAKFYDRTPEEIERAMQKWIEGMIKVWTQELVNGELAGPKSAVMQELCYYFYSAQKAYKQNRLEQAQEFYKKILQIGTSVYNRGEEYVKERIELEKRLRQDNLLAVLYYKEGKLSQAKELWEKIIEEAKPSPMNLEVEKCP